MGFIVLAKAMKDQLSYSEMIDLLSARNISKEELNNKVLSLLGTDQEHNKVFLGEAVEYQNKNNELEDALASDNKILQEIIEKYYEVECCPSFLYHQALLHEEDYKFAIEIYSNMFGLDKNIGEDCYIKLKELLDEHSKKIIEQDRLQNNE